MPVQVNGMHAKSGIEICCVFTDAHQTSPPRLMDSRDNQRFDSYSASLCNDVFIVGVEYLGVNMAMGVDEVKYFHHSKFLPT
jgi:hypothetical protein